jgi:isoleucyl-tRNA synthetase
MSAQSQSSPLKVETFRKTPDLPQLETRIQQFWQDEQIFEKSVSQRPQDNSFVFYDGPPFATGLPHYGHILASTMKDVIPRFQTMQGKRVERVWGWDCHGLPLENLIEKELEIDTKHEIEELGVAKFNETCRSKVLRYADEWQKIIKRLGRWIDMENDYKTMDQSYMETVWWIFKQLWDQDLIYHGHKPMHICPRCGTPLSNFEVNLGYQEIKDVSVVVQFQLEADQVLKYQAQGQGQLELDSSQAQLNLLAWTTTPWTLPGNCLLAINPDESYLLIKEVEGASTAKSAQQTSAQQSSAQQSSAGQDQFYLVAEQRASAIFDNLSQGLEPAAVANTENAISNDHSNNNQAKNRQGQVMGTVQAQDLIDLHYQPLFPYFAETDNAFRVVTADFVTMEEGTGIVHVAPGFGEDDYHLGQEQNVELVQHVRPDGRFSQEVSDFAELKVKPKGDPKRTDRRIANWLDEHGQLFKQEIVRHTYPHCWRCDTPLLNYAADSWFVAVTKFKEQLLANNQEISWVPAHMKQGRFGNWLKGAVDWAISRDRYWGAPLPVWESEDGDRICVGSVAELEELSGQTVEDLHKHFVDQIKIEKDGKIYQRIPQVFDCWFESGSMPYAQHHYPFENKEQFKHRFPADFISEGEDQTRGWFYTLHVLATALTLAGEDSPLPVEDCTSAFQNVVVTGMILARDGKKMSKRLKNYPDPVEVIDQFGADSLRLYLMQSPVVKAETLRFNKQHVSQLQRKVFLIWWNMISFYKLFANQEQFTNQEQSITPTSCPPPAQHVMDRWLQSRVNSLTQQVTSALQTYDLTKATRVLIDFVNQLSTWYLRLSRDRLKADENQEVSRVFAWALYRLAQLYAPFTPFFSELVHHNLLSQDELNKTPSIHLTDWPQAETQLVDDQLEQEMQVVEKIVELGRSLRRDKQIKLRHPLAKVKVELSQPLAAQNELEALIKNELNVKEVEWLQAEEKLAVDYDFELTPALKQEAEAKDLIRKIQNKRRKAGLKISDQAEVHLPAWPQDWQQEIEERTNTSLTKADEFQLWFEGEQQA